MHNNGPIWISVVMIYATFVKEKWRSPKMYFEHLNSPTQINGSSFKALRSPISAHSQKRGFPKWGHFIAVICTTSSETTISAVWIGERNVSHVWKQECWFNQLHSLTKTTTRNHSTSQQNKTKQNKNKNKHTSLWQLYISFKSPWWDICKQ